MRTIRTTTSVQPQSTSRQIMIRPAAFGYNAETGDTNVFQNQDGEVANVSEAAIREFDSMVQYLTASGVEITVFDDLPGGASPDAVFPNNWISFHQSGKIVLYPMMAENRRNERRMDLIDNLRTRFHVEEVIDLTGFEKEGKFLEGTGSMVLDRRYKIAYAALSPRTHKEPLEAFSSALGYEIISFQASDKNDVPIYHTNVMMCVGDSFAVVCLEALRNVDERYMLRSVLEETQKQIIEISLEQVSDFAGNMLMVRNASGEKLMVMSSRAYYSLTTTQRNELEEYTGHLVYMDITTIENMGGGSVRCMLAENHLPLK